MSDPNKWIHDFRAFLNDKRFPTTECTNYLKHVYTHIRNSNMTIEDIQDMEIVLKETLNELGKKRMVSDV